MVSAPGSGAPTAGLKDPGDDGRVRAPSPARPSVPLLRASPHKRRQLACAKKGVPSFVRGLRVGRLLRTHPSLTFSQEQYTIRVCTERGVRVEVRSRPCSGAGVVHTMRAHTDQQSRDAARGECCLEPSLSVPRCRLNRGSHAPKRQPDTAIDGQGEGGARVDSASVGCERGRGATGWMRKTRVREKGLPSQHTPFFLFPLPLLSHVDPRPRRVRTPGRRRRRCSRRQPAGRRRPRAEGEGQGGQCRQGQNREGGSRSTACLQRERACGVDRGGLGCRSLLQADEVDP